MADRADSHSVTAATTETLDDAYQRAFQLYMDGAHFDQVGPALEHARAARELLTKRAVEYAVQRGRSWSDIGAALGVSLQAVSQKIGHLRT